MFNPRYLRPPPLQRVLSWLHVLLILKVTCGIVARYRDYFPPDFGSEFLWGREVYFQGGYGVAFYAHIVSGPLTLLLGLVLVAEGLQTRLPKVHRVLGKLQGALVLLVLAPSGLWMAFYAESIAAIGFALLAVATAACVALGWRAAVRRRFVEHRKWMWRCFLLLCSAVVVRLVGGLVTVTGVGGEWSYPVAAWASWILPLAAYEWYSWRKVTSQRVRRVRSGTEPAAATGQRLPAAAGRQSSLASSLPAIETSARS